MIKLAEQAFRLTHVSHKGSLQATGFLSDGSFYSIVQTPMNIKGEHEITYEVMVGDDALLGWLSSDEFDGAVSAWLAEAEHTGGE